MSCGACEEYAKQQQEREAKEPPIDYSLPSYEKFSTDSKAKGFEITQDFIQMVKNIFTRGWYPDENTDYSMYLNNRVIFEAVRTRWNTICRMHFGLSSDSVSEWYRGRFNVGTDQDNKLYIEVGYICGGYMQFRCISDIFKPSLIWKDLKYYEDGLPMRDPPRRDSMYYPGLGQEFEETKKKQ